PALVGDLVNEFQRLADWRTMFGIRSAVITISSIVDGAHGDFTENGFARDLPEVIRHFLKFAHRRWGTIYVVLGGDVNVVPMRYLIGSGRPNRIASEFGNKLDEDNPPLPGKCYFLSGHAACKVNSVAVPDINEPFSSYHGGVRIPYNRDAGPGQLGWYFTNEDDFNNLDEGFTRLPDTQPTTFVIVEGPESV